MIGQDRLLTKLRIEGFSEREMKPSSSQGSVEAMYNPDALQLNYHMAYVPNTFMDTDVQSNYYQQAHPGNLDLELIFDARMPGNWRSIEQQITQLKLLCCTVNAESKEPHFLKVTWGKLPMGSGAIRDFAGRATNFTINYSFFDRDGTPLRASVRLALVEDASLSLQQAQQSLQAPTQSLMSVPDNTPLSMIASSAAVGVAGELDYLSLAASNDLSSLRAIDPGQYLVL
ncbi:hypothetical protein [Shewanella sp. YLB-07]|uniref:CIS tube protein n=1 Tax=Shewanella sp. YLB-07 TaxID=2601268 RepID=UPI00128C7B65|nr:hypothetical protein [Shewanella sp. YLB-07]MPY24384.1 hypothetical protein [Shewanella sp. YLB-07]